MTQRCSFVVLTTVLLLAGVGSSAFAEGSYVGAKKCRPCHLKQYTTWETTNMAQSFELLKPGVRGAELVEGLSSSEIRRLAAIGRRRTLGAGEDVVLLGDNAD